MNGRGKSGSLIVPVKLTNKDGGALASAEKVEGRRLAKGNSDQQTRYRTQCRADLQHELGYENNFIIIVSLLSQKVIVISSLFK
jgi:hypothetical protein